MPEAFVGYPQRNQTAELTDDVSLHPELTAFKALYDEGNLRY